MVAEPGNLPPGLNFGEAKQKRDFGEPQQKSHFGETEQKRQVVDHHFLGKEGENLVTLRSVSDKIDTVMEIVQDTDI